MGKDAEKLVRQIAGSMAIEGMKLSETEYDVLLRCASGQQSVSQTIQETVLRYMVK